MRQNQKIIFLGGLLVLILLIAAFAIGSSQGLFGTAPDPTNKNKPAKDNDIILDADATAQLFSFLSLSEAVESYYFETADYGADYEVLGLTEDIANENVTLTVVVKQETPPYLAWLADVQSSQDTPAQDAILQATDKDDNLLAVWELKGVVIGEVGALVKHNGLNIVTQDVTLKFQDVRRLQ